MSATDKLIEILKALPALDPFITLYRRLGLSDDEIVVRLKDVVEVAEKERQ